MSLYTLLENRRVRKAVCCSKVPSTPLKVPTARGYAAAVAYDHIREHVCVHDSADLSRFTLAQSRALRTALASAERDAELYPANRATNSRNGADLADVLIYIRSAAATNPGTKASAVLAAVADDIEGRFA